MLIVTLDVVIKLLCQHCHIAGSVCVHHLHSRRHLLIFGMFFQAAILANCHSLFTCFRFGESRELLLFCNILKVVLLYFIVLLCRLKHYAIAST